MVNVGESVRLALRDWDAGEIDAAMLHACNAVDGTSKKLWPGEAVGRRFVAFIRDNYDVFGPMAAPGVDLEKSRFVVVTRIGARELDMAELIYKVHRCCHGHGDELPSGFQMMADAAGQPGRTRLEFSAPSAGGRARISDRTIFGLIAICVANPVNADQRAGAVDFLTFGRSHFFTINDHWGDHAAFEAAVSSVSLPSVAFRFEWLPR